MLILKLLVNTIAVLTLTHLFKFLPWIDFEDRSLIGVFLCWFVQGIFGLDSLLVYINEIMTSDRGRTRNSLELLMLLLSVTVPFLLTTYVISQGGNSLFVSVLLFLPPLLWLGHEFVTPWVGTFRAYGQVLWLIPQYIWFVLSSFFNPAEDEDRSFMIEINYDLVMMQLGATGLAFVAVYLKAGFLPVLEIVRIALFSLLIGIPDKFFPKNE